MTTKKNHKQSLHSAVLSIVSLAHFRSGNIFLHCSSWHYINKTHTINVLFLIHIPKKHTLRHKNLVRLSRKFNRGTTLLSLCMRQKHRNILSAEKREANVSIQYFKLKKKIMLLLLNHQCMYCITYLYFCHMIHRALPKVYSV